MKRFQFFSLQRTNLASARPPEDCTTASRRVAGISAYNAPVVFEPLPGRCRIVWTIRRGVVKYHLKLNSFRVGNMVLHQEAECRWSGIGIHPYKEDGTIFKSVTRQTLARGTSNLPVELRYFEVGEGGHSTLERHDHSHLVTIVRGSGQVLVGDEVHEIGNLDVVQIPPMTWHQFQATRGETLGFLCVVCEERDRPQRPNEEDLQQFESSPTVAEFIKV